MTRYKLALGILAVTATACTPKDLSSLTNPSNPAYNGNPCHQCDGPTDTITVRNGTDNLCVTLGAKYAELHDITGQAC